MSDRDLSHLTPALAELCQKHLDACKAAGLDVFVTFTRRTLEEQMALFAQGRHELDLVNEFRKTAGMLPITAAENAHCVTWTMSSKHLPGPDGLARAYDVAIRDGAGVEWNAKADGNHNGYPDYLEVANLGKALGLECGYFWHQQDAAHFQIDPIP